MSPQDGAANSSFPFPPFLGDLPTLHSKLKRPVPCLIPSEAKSDCATDETVVPSKFRCVAPCNSDSTRGCVPHSDLANDGTNTVISRRSWDWESKGKSARAALTADRERHSFQVTDTSGPSPWVPEKRTHRSTWAGPTLMDIESALALMRPVTSPMASPKSTNTSTGSVPPLLREGLNEGTCSQRTPYDAMDSTLHGSGGEERIESVSQKNEETNERAGVADIDKKGFLTTKLQKRTVPEARYAIKVRSEADNLEDGYRWRKYGQKFIKSNAHPRSYYRCTGAKCQVKKQVERSSTEPGILEVSYEGIHLHHRPYPNTSSLRPQFSDQQEITTVFAEDEQQQSSPPSTTAASISSNKLDLHQTSEKSADRTRLLECFKLQLAASNQPLRRPTAWLVDHLITNANRSSFPSHPNRGLLQDLLPPTLINRAPENL